MGKDLIIQPVTSKYVLLKGNNHGVVNRVMAGRTNWERIQPQGNTLFDFKWTPCSYQINYEFLGKHGEKHLVNHFEHHAQITQKDLLFFNTLKVCETLRRNVFDFVPITFVFDFSENKNQEATIDKFTMFFTLLEKNKQSEAAVINKLLQCHPNLAPR